MANQIQIQPALVRGMVQAMGAEVAAVEQTRQAAAAALDALAAGDYRGYASSGIAQGYAALALGQQAHANWPGLAGDIEATVQAFEQADTSYTAPPAVVPAVPMAAVTGAGVGAAPVSLVMPMGPITTTPAAPAAPAPIDRPVSEWSAAEKLMAAIERSLPYMPDEIAERFRELLTPESLALLAGTLALWAASHAIGVGFVVDALLLVGGGLALGWSVWRGGKELVSFLNGALDAESEADLDAAGEHFATGVSILGVDATVAFLTHKAGSAGLGSRGTQVAREVELVTPEGLRIRVPAPEAPPRMEARAQGSGGAAVQGGDDASRAANAQPSTPTGPKNPSKRLQYLGRTPGKGSRTGLQVIERMESQELIREVTPGNKEVFHASTNKWYPIEQTDMGHTHDAVNWWNTVGRQYGPKSPEVRTWMLDPKNYVLEPTSINRSRGALLTETYEDPLPSQGE